MYKVLSQIALDLLFIFFATVVTLMLLGFIIDIGPESTSKGWAELYLIIVSVSVVSIFVFDGELPTQHKIYGVLFVSVVTGLCLYLWMLISPVSCFLAGILLGYPFLLTTTKQLYKFIILTSHFTKSS